MGVKRSIWKDYQNLSKIASKTDWIRFTRILWQDHPISFHFGFNYKGSYMWYKPTFDIDLARHSPGEVLLRQLLLQAQKENAHTFDFGLGDEPFKRRFATCTHMVKTWGLYPKLDAFFRDFFVETKFYKKLDLWPPSDLEKFWPQLLEEEEASEKGIFFVLKTNYKKPLLFTDMNMNEYWGIEPLMHLRAKTEKKDTWLNVYFYDDVLKVL